MGCLQFVRMAVVGLLVATGLLAVQPSDAVAGEDRHHIAVNPDPAVVFLSGGQTELSISFDAPPSTHFGWTIGWTVRSPSGRVVVDEKQAVAREAAPAIIVPVSLDPDDGPGRYGVDAKLFFTSGSSPLYEGSGFFAVRRPRSFTSAENVRGLRLEARSRLELPEGAVGLNRDAQVLLQRKVDGRWRVVDVLRTNEYGRVSFRIGRPGRYRAATPAHGQAYTRSVSRAIRFG